MAVAPAQPIYKQRRCFRSLPLPQPPRLSSSLGPWLESQPDAPPPLVLEQVVEGVLRDAREGARAEEDSIQSGAWGLGGWGWGGGRGSLVPPVRLFIGARPVCAVLL